MQLTKTGELQAGEYRSHLYFRAVPTRKPLGDPEEKTDSSISVRLVPVFGISMPVIIRSGVSDASVNFSDVTFFEKEGQPAIRMALQREGNMSVYGDIAVDHISVQGKISRVGLIKGLAVYTPNTKRRFEMMLDKNALPDYRTGKLKLSYLDQSARPNKLAEHEIQLQ